MIARGVDSEDLAHHLDPVFLRYDDVGCHECRPVLAVQAYPLSAVGGLDDLVAVEYECRSD